MPTVNLMPNICEGWTVVSGEGDPVVLYPHGGFRRRKDAVRWALDVFGRSFHITFSRWFVPLVRRRWRVIPIRVYLQED